ncbi:Uncharacterized protein HZ326_7782 [Fusarium oxysporum f. sp. albedinis]|nr:Uncharacterized protein HZ326_7782 [Fusarium oxysporum f. sp. albedinis]
MLHDFYKISKRFYRFTPKLVICLIIWVSMIVIKKFRCPSPMVTTSSVVLNYGTEAKSIHTHIDLLGL